MRTDFFTSQKTVLARKEEPVIFTTGEDVPDDTSTDATIIVGETISSAIDVLNDQDYFAIAMFEGQAITITVNSAAIGATINFRDVTDGILATISAPAIGEVKLDVTADSTGIFFIDISSLLGLGAYEVSVGPQAGANETIVGTDEPETIFGYDGNDTIEGRGGNDSLYGNDGNDHLFGGNGWDTLIGGNGYDVLSGGNGNDTLYGLNGPDFLGGGAGDDLVFGGDGDDFIQGGGGNDELRGQMGDDIIDGDWGNDELHGGGNNDELYGGEGDDLLYGSNGYDFLVGDEGNDTLYGGNGNDRMAGRADDDILYGGSGDDRMHGGGGDDFLFGDDGDDILIGGSGNDRLAGGEGNDTFIVGNPESEDDSTIIEDFAEGDIIGLDASVFTGILNLGALLETEFALGTEAGDSDDRIIYDETTGNIFYDEDGAGGVDQVLIAQVTAGTVLDASAFAKVDVDLLGLPLASEPPKDLAMANPAEFVVA